MKNLINKILFLVTILTISISVFPQSRKIEQKTVKKQQQFHDDSDGVKKYDEVTIKFNGYYDEDDKFVYHGPVTSNNSVTYNGDGWMLAKGVTLTITYKVNGNYVDGKLNGPFTISKFHKVTSSRYTATFKYDLSANYAKGVPNGKWSVVGSETATLDGQSVKENYNLVATYKNGKIVYYDNGKGGKFTFNDDGTISGKDNDDTYKNSINTSNFIRKTGEVTGLSDEAKLLVDGLIKGDITDSILFEKGYVLNRRAVDFFYAMTMCDYWMDFFDIYTYDSNFESSRSLDKSNENYATILKTLKRVDFLSWEDLKKTYLEEIDFSKFNFNENRYYNARDYFDRSSTESKYRSIDILLQSNKLIVDDQYSYYYKDDVKEMIVSYLAEKQLEEERRIAEEKRLEEERRIAEEKRLAEEQKFLQNRKEIAVKALDKLVKVSNVKEMKFWGVDVVLSADYDLRTGGEWDWLIFKGHKTDIIPQLTHFCPMVGYEIISVEFANDSKKDVLVKCLVHKFISKKEGYESYQVNLVVDSRYVDMSKSFNFKQAVKVENDWDKIRSLKAQIEENKNKINAEKDKFLSDVVSAYTKYHKTCDFEVSDNTTEAINRFNEVIKNQNQCFEFIELRKQINTNDVAILGYASQCKNIVKLYSTYFKSLDLSWNTAENAKDKLLEIIATQDELKLDLSSEYASLLENAIIIEKIKDLKSTLECFKTINLRKQLYDNDVAIQGYSKQYKNITKIYIAYFKKLDFTWVSADASKVKFEEVIANQNIIRKALESSNATELDTAVKKEKIKDIQTLVNRLK